MDESKKIKLLIITPTLECGGSEKYVSILCNNIDTQKFTVTLAVVNNAAAFYTISNKAVRVIDLHKKHVRNSLFKIIAVIKKQQPDIVYTTANHLNIFLAIFKKVVASKSILIARESSIVSYNAKRSKFPLLINWLTKRFYKQFTVVICQSAYMQQDLIANYNMHENNTALIYNAVDVPKNVPVLNTANPKKFITVARLSKEKGIDRLIKAVAQLSTPFQYFIIGEGDQMEYLHQLIVQYNLESKVFLQGKKQYPFLGNEDAALFLMGSYYEGFPNTLLEAGALGIPAVAFNAPGGISEIIVDGKNGMLVKEMTTAAFKNTIEKALILDFNRHQIRQMVLKRFAVTEVVKQTETYLMKLQSSISANI